MRSLTQSIIHQLQQHYRLPILKDARDTWYTGADILEDFTLCQTSLKQQSVTRGQSLLISSDQSATIPALLLASWQLGLTVTLTPPSHQLPELTPQAYAVMVYSPEQSNQLATQLDPHEISQLTLLLNTAPRFAYLVHDHANSMTRTSQPDLILPASQDQLTQQDLFTLAATRTPQTPIAELYDLKGGLIPCLANLLTATPFTFRSTES